jgi:TPR repeat protein
MANREELGIIRGARGGQPDAQLELGRLYLYGSAGLPKSLPTALHWLDRAAQQGCDKACELIGAHIPVELALQSSRPLAQWYERAYDAGVVRAGMVLAQLTFEQQSEADQARRDKALRALESAARAGVPDAKWLYARYQGGQDARPAAGAAPAVTLTSTPAPERWRARPAEPAPAQSGAPLDALWMEGDHDRFLARALPLARALLRTDQGTLRPAGCLSRDDVSLLSRCAQALSQAPGTLAGPEEIRRFWELAANEHDPQAQMALGLWHARMLVDGRRISAGPGSANFKKAIRWLLLAGEQGLAEAWYALSRIYIKPEFSQRNVADAQGYLERAAGMGYRDAQLECGNNAWRARRENEGNDVRAVYWLQKAAGQGCQQAAAALLKIAPRPASGAFAAMCARAPAALARSHPLLDARLRLAALFSLTRAEALLLDVRAADQGHCLVIDIRGSYGRSKRRLIAIASAHERRALDEIVQEFGAMDGGPAGLEGNYRQRLYRLKTVMPEALSCEESEAQGYEMAA